MPDRACEARPEHLWRKQGSSMHPRLRPLPSLCQTFCSHQGAVAALTRRGPRELKRLFKPELCSPFTCAHFSLTLSPLSLHCVPPTALCRHQGAAAVVEPGGAVPVLGAHQGPGRSTLGACGAAEPGQPGPQRHAAPHQPAAPLPSERMQLQLKGLGSNGVFVGITEW